MAGIMMSMVQSGASASGVPPTGTIIFSYTGNGAGVDGGNITFGSNGAISGAGINDGTGGQGSGPISWYDPNTGSIGSSYWIRVTATSGSFTSNPATGWTSLSAGVTVSKTVGPSSSQTVTFDVEFATDSGGSNIVGTWTGNELTADN